MICADGDHENPDALAHPRPRARAGGGKPLTSASGRRAPRPRRTVPFRRGALGSGSPWIVPCSQGTIQDLLSVAGMPVNLPTNGHGQGYADLNFVIPELVGSIQYKKGTCYAEEGARLVDPGERPGRAARRPSLGASAANTSTWSRKPGRLRWTWNGRASRAAENSSSSTKHRPGRRSFPACGGPSTASAGGTDVSCCSGRFRRR